MRPSRFNSFFKPVSLITALGHKSSQVKAVPPHRLLHLNATGDTYRPDGAPGSVRMMVRAYGQSLAEKGLVLESTLIG